MGSSRNSLAWPAWLNLAQIGSAWFGGGRLRGRAAGPEAIEAWQLHLALPNRICMSSRPATYIHAHFATSQRPWQWQVYGQGPWLTTSRQPALLQSPSSCPSMSLLFCRQYAPFGIGPKVQEPPSSLLHVALLEPKGCSKVSQQQRKLGGLMPWETEETWKYLCLAQVHWLLHVPVSLGIFARFALQTPPLQHQAL